MVDHFNIETNRHFSILGKENILSCVKKTHMHLSIYQINDTHFTANFF